MSIPASVPPHNALILSTINGLAKEIESRLSADLLTINSPIVDGLHALVCSALDLVPSNTRRAKLAIVLTTDGGLAETSDRLAQAFRKRYNEVVFIVPDRAMSAGTLLVLSGDEVFLSDFACLGPIDPQIPIDNQLIPALAYIDAVEEMQERAVKQQLTAVDFALLQRIDIARLQTIRQHRELAIQLLKDWLSRYKFKNWSETRDRQIPVTQEMRTESARKVAEALSDNRKWLSHSRALSAGMLEEIGLQVRSTHDLPNDSGDLIRRYADIVAALKSQSNIFMLVHSLHYL